MEAQFVVNLTVYVILSWQEAVTIPWRALPKKVTKLYLAMRGVGKLHRFFFSFERTKNKKHGG